MTSRSTHKALKRRLVEIFSNYIVNENKFVEQNVDKKKFYLERRSYLESCVRSLKDKFYKNIHMHKSDNKRIMKGDLTRKRRSDWGH